MTRFSLHCLGQGLPTEAGNKACYLDRLFQAGLSVPKGCALIFEADVPYTDLAEAALSALSTERPMDGPDQPTFAVRSSFPGEDSASESQAGQFRSHLHVPRERLAWALEDVYLSGENCGYPRRSVLIQDMVSARQSGVLFHQPAYLDPLVLYTEGTAEHLLAGEEAGVGQELSPAEGGRLAQWRHLALEVERVLGPGQQGWDIEFADDGTTVWLVQARPITRSPLRDELFSYANIREIMPDPPSPFMASIVGAAGERLYQYYRNFDPRLPAGRPLIEVFLGRPMFNISLLMETMRRWGLPTRLVTDQIGGADVASAGLSPQILVAKFPALVRQAWAQIQAVSVARRATTELGHLRVEGDLAALAESVQDLFEHLVTVMLNLTAAMAVPLSLLRLLGVLEEHSRRHRTPTGRMLSDLEPLRKLVLGNPQWRHQLERGEAPDREDFQIPWKAYLEAHGHRGFFESDLARPRFADQPAPVLRSLLGPSAQERPSQATTWLGRLTWPIWIYTRRLIDTRELWRNAAMRAYAELRAAILLEAERLGCSNPEAVFDLKAQEWKELARGRQFDSQFWTDREQENEDLRRYHVPDLMRRSHPRSAMLAPEQREVRQRVEGTPLCAGSVNGTIWKAEDASSQPPAADGTAWILLTRTVDPGWLFQLPRFAGVIVELGGDLSHGSILLRELGMPSITNASGATAAFSSGDKVRLQAGEGYAEKR